MRSHSIQIEQKYDVRFVGISHGCEHLFFVEKAFVHIYKLNDILSTPIPPTPRLIKFLAKIAKYSDPPFYSIPRPVSESGNPKKESFLAARVGKAICVTISNISCYAHEINGNKHRNGNAGGGGTDLSSGRYPRQPRDPKLITKIQGTEQYSITCVAISEADIGYIIIAIGFKYDGFDDFPGTVELYCLAQYDWKEFFHIDAMDVGDSPKTLEFSFDGSVLSCTTNRNHLHAWQLRNARFSEKPVKICDTIRSLGSVCNHLVFERRWSISNIIFYLESQR
jgi:hypothetical protein